MFDIICRTYDASTSSFFSSQTLPSIAITTQHFQFGQNLKLRLSLLYHSRSWTTPPLFLSPGGGILSITDMPRILHRFFSFCIQQVPLCKIFCIFTCPFSTLTTAFCLLCLLRVYTGKSFIASYNVPNLNLFLDFTTILSVSAFTCLTLVSRPFRSTLISQRSELSNLTMWCKHMFFRLLYTLPTCVRFIWSILPDTEMSVICMHGQIWNMFLAL